MAMVTVGHNRVPVFSLIIMYCLSDDNGILSFGTHQVSKYVSGIYIMFCTFVVIMRTDATMLWRPYNMLSHSFEKYIVCRRR